MNLRIGTARVQVRTCEKCAITLTPTLRQRHCAQLFAHLIYIFYIECHTAFFQTAYAITVKMMKLCVDPGIKSGQSKTIRFTHLSAILMSP